jgi:hypothetical protein
MVDPVGGWLSGWAGHPVLIVRVYVCVCVCV